VCVRLSFALPISLTHVALLCFSSFSHFTANNRFLIDGRSETRAVFFSFFSSRLFRRTSFLLPLPRHHHRRPQASYFPKATPQQTSRTEALLTLSVSFLSLPRSNPPQFYTRGPSFLRSSDSSFRLQYLIEQIPFKLTSIEYLESFQALLVLRVAKSFLLLCARLK